MFEGSKGPNKELEDKYVEVLGWVTAMVKRGYVADTDHVTLADLSFVSTFSTLKVRKQDFKKSMTASKTDFPKNIFCNRGTQFCVTAGSTLIYISAIKGVWPIKNHLIFLQFLLFLFSFFLLFQIYLISKDHV